MVRALKLFEQLAQSAQLEKEAAKKAAASGKKKTKVLQSTRFDAMYIPNHSWDFFDTYTAALPTATALAQHEPSTQGENLQKYLKVLHQHNKEELARSLVRPGQKVLPPYLTQLLQLQERNGKFEHLQDVLVALGMPFDLTFQFSERYEEHEFAGAYAIALMRQHTELFELLVDAHDKALKWVHTNELIYQAREHITKHFQTVNYCNNPFASTASTVTTDSGRSELGTFPKANISLNTDGKASVSEGSVGSVSEAATMESVTSSLSSIAMHADPSAHSLLMQNNAFQFTAVSADLKHVPIHEADHEDLDSISSSVIQPAASNSASRPGSPAKGDFSNLMASLHQFSGAFSEEELNAQRKVVADIEMGVIDMCMEIEGLAKDVSLCLDRCVAAYNASELFIDRYKTFDELTARLGQGFPATPAYDDWRKEGVPGIRPKIVSFLNLVQLMSEERLTLREMLTPEGRDWSKKNNLDFNRSRWILAWNGHDVVLKVLHCLDFLRKCREISDWYGPSYYFVANPLQLPFPLANAYEGLQLDGRVMELLKTQPHDHVGIGNVEQKRDWSFQQFLNDFRRRFIVMTKDWSFNWPVLPPVREDDENYQFGIAMLVLFVACGDSIRRSNQWEKKFITSISSLRGAAHHLVGEANLRTNKPLKVPALEDRVPRPALLKQMEELLKKRQSMRTKSTDNPDLLQDSMFSYSYETHSSVVEPSLHEESAAGLKRLDSEDDYYHIQLHNQNKIKQFAKMLTTAGGALEADAQIIEKANINPNSAPAPFKYDPKRRTTSAGKKRVSVSQPGGGGTSPQRKQSTLSPMRRSSSMLPPDGSRGGGEGHANRTSGIRTSILQPRGSISQPSTTTLNASSSSTLLSPLREGRASVIGSGRKLSAAGGAASPANQRTSILRKNSTLTTLHENDGPKTVGTNLSRPTSARPSSAKLLIASRPSSARLSSPLLPIPAAGKKSILVHNSAPMNSSMVSAGESMVLETSTGSEVFETNAAGKGLDRSQIAAVLSATVGKKDSPHRKTINNGGAKKKLSTIQQPLKGESVFSLQSDSIPNPTTAATTGNAMPQVKEEKRAKPRPSKILDREALSKEGTQSRRVSRLPMTKDTVATETGGVVPTQKMTKRRPSSREQS